MDYDYDSPDPFADMDYEEIMAWAQENRSVLISPLK